MLGEKPEIWDGVLQRIYRSRRDGELPLLVRAEIPLSALLAASMEYEQENAIAAHGFPEIPALQKLASIY